MGIRASKASAPAIRSGWRRFAWLDLDLALDLVNSAPSGASAALPHTLHPLSELHLSENQVCSQVSHRPTSCKNHCPQPDLAGEIFKLPQYHILATSSPAHHPLELPRTQSSGGVFLSSRLVCPDDINKNHSLCPRYHPAPNDLSTTTP